jgi:hypothetical protein
MLAFIRLIPEKWSAILQIFDQLLQINIPPLRVTERMHYQSKGKTAAIEEAGSWL